FTWVNGLYADDKLVDAAVIAHELGHNLGVAHAASLACTTAAAGEPSVALLASTNCKLPRSSSDSSTAQPVTEYGDPFDMMGTYSYQFLWRGTELMSSWRRAQVLQLPTASQQVVTTAGTYTLESSAASSGRRLIRIARGTGSASGMPELALEYRPAGATFDQWALDSQTGGVFVRRTPGLNDSGLSYLLDGTPATRQPYVDASGAEFQKAWRDAALQPGRSLRDAATGIMVRVNGVAGTTATVTLSGGPLGSLPTSTPTPTPVPASTPSPLPATPAPTATPTTPAPPTAAPTPEFLPAASTLPPSSGAGLPPATQSDRLPVLAPSLVWPASRKGVRRLAATRKIIVSF
ncbi:MAG: hypothetical protein ACK4N5_26885, partial [Myxococcales bacterium]